MTPIKEMLAPISKARSGRKRTGFVGITIHNTDNYSKGAGALSHALYMRNSGYKTPTSWHYVVDDKLITRIIPENEIAWHAADGRGNGNYKTICIEICVNPESDLKKATDNAAELAADILKRNGYKIADGHLFQHNHWSGKNCPREIRKNNPYSWTEFCEKVNSFMEDKMKIRTETKVYETLEEIPDWGKPLVKEYITKYGLTGDGKGKINISEDTLHAMHILEKRLK